MRIAPAIFFGAFAGDRVGIVSTHDKFEGPLGLAVGALIFWLAWREAERW